MKHIKILSGYVFFPKLKKPDCEWDNRKGEQCKLILGQCGGKQMIWKLSEPAYLLKTSMFLQRYVYVLRKTAALKSADRLYKRLMPMGWVRKEWGQTTMIYGLKVPHTESSQGRRDSKPSCLWGPRSSSALRLHIPSKSLLKEENFLWSSQREWHFTVIKVYEEPTKNTQELQDWMTCHFSSYQDTKLSVCSVAEWPDHSRDIKEPFFLRHQEIQPGI